MCLSLLVKEFEIFERILRKWHCSVFQKVTVTWYRDGIPVDGISNLLTLRNGSLHTTETMASDEAVYHCDGTNSLGTVSSPNVTVTLASKGHHFCCKNISVFIDKRLCM